MMRQRASDNGVIERIRRIGRRSTRSTHIPPTLRDPVLQTRLSSEGFVVVDLLSESDTAALLQVCNELHPTSNGGWESDFYSPSPEVKATAQRSIAAGFAAAVEREFVDHRSLMHNFVLNWPGPDGGLVLHQHSTLVDDRRFRSAIVWCGLTHADVANGTLHVVPRSHLVQRGPRPERGASWHDPHIETILRDYLVPVPVRPGQAIIFDNQLLHCSFANTTDRPRLTAVAVVIPNAAEPLYYESGGDSTVMVHRLDPEFFLQNVAGDLEWARPDGLELLEEAPWEPTVVTESELDRLLGPHPA